MPTETSPHEAARETVHDVQSYAFLDMGVVTSAPTQTEDEAHHVTVGETQVPADKPVPVIPPVHGDYYVPPEGAPVLIAYTEENDGVVLGAPVAGGNTPDIDPGERHLSHAASRATVHFTTDGDVEIVADDGTAVEVSVDGTVTINGGDQGAVTDVSIDETNSNGGATSLTVTRNSNVLL